MATYLRLFPATTQFELTNGQLNVAGRLYVYFEGTDDLADVYDEDGTRLPNPVILDNDGRAAGLFVDSSKVYWLKVCNQFDAQVFTVRKMVPSGGGAGSALGKSYEVISSDGTVDVQTYSDAGVITFDLSTQLEQQSSPFGGFIAMASSVAGDGEWHEVPVVSSQGDITYMSGWNVQSDCVGDIAASLEMTSGDPAALHTIDVMCMFTVDGSAVTNEFGMLDPSEPYGRVSFEWKGALVDDNHVDVKFFVRSNGAATVGLIGRALYNEEVEGIIGNGGGGAGEYYGGDYIEISGQVINATGLQPLSGMSSYQTTAGMSAYATTAALADKLDASASSSFQPSGDYVSSSDLTAYQPTSSMGNYQLTADMTAYMPISATAGLFTGVDTDSSMTGNGLSSSPLGVNTAILSGYQEKSGMSSYLETSAFTGYTATALTAIENNITSIQQDISSIESAISGLTGSYVEQSSFSAYTASADSSFVHTGDMSGYATTGELAQKLDASASSEFQPSGNYQTAGDYVSSSELADYQTTAGMSAYQPSGNYQTAGDYVSSSELADYQTTAGMSAYMPTSSASAFMPATANPFTGVETDSSLTGNGLSGSALGINGLELDFDSSMASSVNGNTATVGVNTGILSAYQTTAGMSAYQPSGNYQTAGNYVSSSELAGYQTTAGMSAYQPSGNYVSSSELADYMPTSSASAFMPATANPFTGVETDNTLTGNGLPGNELGVNGLELDFDSSMVSSVSGNTAIVGVNTGILSGYQTTAGMSAYQPSGNYQTAGDYVSSSELADYQTTAGMSSYATTAALTDKLDESASSSFQPSGNYQTAGNYVSSSELADYQTTAGMSAYQPSGNYQTAGDYVSSSELADYQPTAGMSAYQPSGNYQTAGDYVSSSEMSAYIPLSALGLVEI